MPEAWVHHCRMQCDSGLELNHLQEFYFIALDVFQKNGYAKSRNKDDRLAGWLSLLCTEDADVAEELCLTYPWLEEKDLLLSQQAKGIEQLKQMLSKNNMLHEDA